MLKMIGALMLLTGGIGSGFAAIRHLDRRVTALRSLSGAFELLEHELDFRLPPMKTLIKDTARRSSEPASSFLEACVQGIEKNEGTPLSEIWQQAVTDELSALKQSDAETIMLVGEVLGRYDAESQRSFIAATRKRLIEYLSEAVEERSRQGKVYGALGVTAGAFLVILLL